MHSSNILAKDGSKRGDSYLYIYYKPFAGIVEGGVMGQWMLNKKWRRNIKLTPSKEQTDQNNEISRWDLAKKIKQAHLEWETSRLRMEHALTWDEIDYAIYAFEAAQRRYDMLLRQGKQWQLNIIEMGGDNK